MSIRRRLVQGGIGVVAVTLLLFALPLAWVVRSQVVTAGLDGFAGTLEQTATLVDERARTCAEVQVTLAALAREDVAVTVLDRSGTPRFVTDGGAAAPGADRGRVVVAPDVVARAAGGATGAALRSGRQVVAVPLSTTVCGERLVLQASAPDDALQGRVRGAWLVLGAVALLALAVGALAAAAAGRRLAEPLEALATSARRLGDGDVTARAPRSGLEEPDAIADALDRTADRLGRAVTRGTAFAADASHQLRTPLTALRLHLESARAAAEDPSVDASLDAALTEADRLAATVADLVELTHLDAEVREVDLGRLVADRTAAWQARAGQAGRDLVVAAPDGLRRTVRPTAIAQALEVLVDNALRHGRGDVEVRVVPPPPQGGDEAVRIRVTDQGDGMPDGLLADRRDRGGRAAERPATQQRDGAGTGGGRGLVLARDLVEAEGGRLVLGSHEGRTAATILLPS